MYQKMYPKSFHPYWDDLKYGKEWPTSPPLFFFKVGDRVCLPLWGAGRFVRITAVGEDAFLGKETDPARGGVERRSDSIYSQGDNNGGSWRLYVPPTAVYHVSCYDTLSETVLDNLLSYLPNLKVEREVTP